MPSEIRRTEVNGEARTCLSLFTRAADERTV